MEKNMENGKNENGKKEGILDKVKKPFRKVAETLDNVSVLDVMKGCGKAVAVVGTIAGAVVVGATLQGRKQKTIQISGPSEGSGVIPETEHQTFDVPFTEENVVGTETDTNI